MDEYFITKKVVEIIIENINDHFIKCLVSLSIRERYADDTKVIIGIIELLKTYMETRRNDILSSCIKYTNKSYYQQLTDSLFRLVQSHLTIAKRYVFLFDLIDKYNNPVISINNNDTSEYNADIDDDRTLLPQSTTKDAGTLFKDAYYKLKKTKDKDIELQMLKEKDSGDLL
jgi:hypothetical protein